MKITTTVTVAMERADGSVSEHAERVVVDAGDNPRYDVDSVSRSIGEPASRVLASVRAGRSDQLEASPL